MYPLHLKCRYIICIVFFSVLIPFRAFSQLSVSWVSTFDNSGDDKINDIAVNSNGELFATGYQNSSEGEDFVLIKYDAAGNETWVRTISEDESDQGKYVKINSTDEVVVGGYTTSTNGKDFLLVKYNADGTLVWRVDFNEENFNDDDEITGIDIDDQDNIYVTGYNVNNGRKYIRIKKYDNEGVEQWDYRYDDGGHLDDEPVAIHYSIQDSYLYVLGNSVNEETGGSDYALFKMNASTGLPVWINFYNNSEYSGSDIAKDLAEISSNILITGKAFKSESNEWDYYTLSISKTDGQVSWDKYYNGNDSNDDRPAGIVADEATQKIIVTGSSVQNGAPDYLTIAYDFEGVVLWTQRYDGQSEEIDEPVSIKLYGGSGVYITGNSISGSTNDILTLRYNIIEGELEFDQTYDYGGSTDDRVVAMVTKDDDIFIGGFTVGTNRDWLAIKYNYTIPLTVYAGVDATICTGQSVNLNALASKPGATFSWSPSTGLSNAGIANPVANPSSTATYQVTATLGAQHATDNVTVFVNSLNLGLSSSFTICKGDYKMLTTGGSATEYSWSPSTGLSCYDCASPVASPDATTTYTLTAKNSSGCSETVSTTVTVNTTAEVQSSQEIYKMCEGGNVQLSVTGQGTYAWTPATGLSNASIANPIASPAVSTVYKVVATNANGCKSEKEISVVVDEEEEELIVIADEEESELSDNYYRVAGDLFSVSLLLNADLIEWKTQDGKLVSTGNTLSLFAKETGVYTVHVKKGNCTYSQDFTLNVSQDPVVRFNFSYPGLNVTFTPLSANMNATYRWNFGDGSEESTQMSPEHSYSAVGKYKVTLIVEDEYGTHSFLRTVPVGTTSTPCCN